MIVTIVYVEVKPEHLDSFLEATRENHFCSIDEPGNLRFDVLQLDGDSGKFALYEAYEDEEAAAAHKQTPHYLEWRERVAPYMAKPREGIRYNAILP